MDVAVVGCGIAGLTSALALSRAGHRVTILERDATPMPASADEAFTAWERRGAPQVRHSHAFLARLRNTLRDRAPDVLDALLAAGATELRFADHLPETLLDRSSHPGDDDLVALACRRTTYEWVLRRAVLDEPGVALLDGVAVVGLTTDAGAPPRVTGVRLADDTTLPAELVLDAGGPRSAGARWLQDAGVPVPPDEVHECGIVYMSRFYRLRPGAEAPETNGPVAVDLGFCKYAVFPGDNGAFSMTLAVPADDAELRRVADARAFDAVAGLLPGAEPWLDGRAEVETDVFVMAGLRNRRRARDDGEPLVLGCAPVGDAAVSTNPLYGRGCSLATVHAFAVADAVSGHDGDLRSLAEAIGAVTARDLDPWYRNAVLQDEQSRAVADATADASAPSDSEDPRAFLRAILRDGLAPAMRLDAVVFRAFLRWFNLLATPESLVSDPDVVGRVMAVFQSRDERPPEPPLGPTREAVAGALADLAAR